MFVHFKGFSSFWWTFDHVSSINLLVYGNMEGGELRMTCKHARASALNLSLNPVLMGKRRGTIRPRRCLY